MALGKFLNIIMNNQEMKTFVESNPSLVSAKPVLDNALLLKYKRNVFFKNLWSKEILDCRGTIVDKDSFELIQRPFRKIFSQGEKYAPTFHDEEMVRCTRKVNGYMLSATIYNGKLLLSTTGSVDSLFVSFAASKFASDFDYCINAGFIVEEYTTMFEVVDKEFDPHVIEEDNGLYFLGILDKTWEIDMGAELPYFYPVYDKIISLKTPDSFGVLFGEISKETDSVCHEGYVVRSLDLQKELKLKSPFYSAVKFLGRISNARIAENLNKLNSPRYFSKRTNDFIRVCLGEIAKTPAEFYQKTEQEKFAFLRNTIKNNFEIK